MPAFPSKQEIAYAASRVAAEVLEDASRRTDTLRARAHDYFPDHDGVDWREIGKQLGEQLRGYAALVEQRERRLLADGRMVKPQ